MKSVFDATRDETAALSQAAELARTNGQIVAWDTSSRWCAVALYDHASKRLQPLTDEEAAVLLNRDSLIRREWRKWNAASKNRGSLIVLNSAHALRILGQYWTGSMMRTR